MGETAPMAAARLALKLVDTEEELAAAKVRTAILEAAARDVTCFDWSDNDPDAVRAVDALRKLVGR